MNSRIRDSGVSKEDENFFGTVFSQLPMGIAVLRGSDFKIEKVNAAFLQLTGKEKKEVEGKNLFDVFSQIKEALQTSLLNVLITGKSFYPEQRISLNEKNLHLICQPLKEEDGNMQSAVLVINENQSLLTEENDARLKIVTEYSALGTWDYNPATKIIRWDKVIRKLFDVEENTKITFELFFSKIHPEDLEPTSQKTLDALNPEIASALDTEYRIISTPDNKVRWVHVKGKAFFDMNKKPYYFAGTMLDITDKRVAIEELKESEQKFRLLADSMPQMIWTGDAEGNLNYFNQTIYDYSGLAPEQIKKDGWIQIVHPDDRSENVRQWAKAINDGQPFLLQHRFRKHTGEYRWQLSRAIPQKDAQGKIQMWVGTSTDMHDQITFAEALENNVEIRTQELKQAIEHLMKTNQELEQFAYISSHDMQEPLRKIQTFSSMMLNKSDYDENTKTYLEKINKSASRMSQLIKDLLNYSMLSKADDRHEDTDLNEILEKVKNDFEVLIKQKHAIIIGTRLPVIKAIPVQMNQLIHNLLGNSLKFCEKRPFIEIAATKLSSYETKKIPELNAESRYYHLMFKDNGIGFSKEFSAQIFTIFQRLHDRQKYSGTGIGLAICKKIVENHRGFISAESTFEKGTTFNIYLPY